MGERADVVRIARGWIGTPYRHQASLKGVGADCLGLIRGVWRELYWVEPEAPPPYSRDWGAADQAEPLWRAAARWLRVSEAPSVGDVLLFRMSPEGPAKHLAIQSSDEGEGAIIHAYSGRSVMETPFATSWRRRLVARFQYPEEA
ncbi:MAG: peptidase [Pseudomonadota bacterium]